MNVAVIDRASPMRFYEALFAKARALSDLLVTMYW